MIKSRAVWGLLGVGLVVGAVVAVRFWPVADAPPQVPPVPAPASPPVAAPLPPAPVPSPPPVALPEETSEAPEAPPPDELAAVDKPLPSLNDSDGFVRGQAAGFNLPSIWTVDGDLVRRFAVLIENAGKGEVPSKRLGLSVLSPAEKFPVRQDGERFFLDPAGYARYDPYLDQLERLAPAALATFVSLLSPLLNEALGELDYGGDAEGAVLAAIDQALAAPVVEGDIELVRPGLMFQYADPALESLGGLQKQVLRMGPRNAQRLHAYLRRLRPLL